MLQVVDVKKVGPALAHIRKKVKGITQAEMAKLLKCSMQTVIKKERTSDISFAELAKWESVLSIKISVIISLDKEDVKRLLGADNEIAP